MSDDNLLARVEALERAVQELCSIIKGSVNPINAKVNGEHCSNHKSRPASYDDVLKYVVGSLKLTENDAAALWEHWQGTGFKVNGRTMKSWKATASCWERQRIFYPSFKNERPGIQPPYRRRQALVQESLRFKL